MKVYFDPIRHLLQNGCLVVSLFLFFELHPGYAQPGRLLIVGGGAEKNGANSWSTPAYKWAGEGKRVAIIGVTTGSLATYFTQQCGASWAKEFAVSDRDQADSQVLFDSLITYEVIFFRGGDQYDYYEFYRDTRLQQAVEHIYGNGGTIGGTSAGMAILSSIVYTAENGSAYPDECIENPNNTYITLEDDFLQLTPGFVFDSHFAERGRFGRLIGFLANYQLNNGISIAGLGMDDMTCMTVDGSGLATVYGTGCANFYLAGCNYTQNGNKLLADTVHVIQLLHQCTYDFSNGVPGFAGLDLPIQPNGLEETGNYTLLASGSNLLTSNQAMLVDFISNCGNASAEVLLLSGDEALAASYRNKLTELGASQVHVFEPVLVNGTDPELASLIGAVTKILFLKNDYTAFSQFLETDNGLLLRQAVKAEGMITAFAGADARYAGKIVVENYLAEYASYYGELTFGEGLSLLQHTVVMPETYLSSDMYENTATAVPYAMAKYALKYGIWLTDHNYMKIAPVEGKTTLLGYGTAPVMIIANAGSLAGLSKQTASGSTSVDPRMVAGFEHLKLTLADYTAPYILGNTTVSSIHPEDGVSAVFLKPNPAHAWLEINCAFEDFQWEIYNSQGVRLSQGKGSGRAAWCEVSNLQPGVFLMKVTDNQDKRLSVSKFIKD